MKNALVTQTFNTVYPLKGTAFMRLVYIDEAGISKKEPATVVVGLIVHGDLQWIPLIAEMDRVWKSCVPNEYQETLPMHASEIWNSHEFRRGWELKDRFDFLRQIMELPRLLGVPISVGIVPRAIELTNRNPGLNLEQLQHLHAFMLCLSNADRFMRDYTHPLELAMVLAEETPKMKGWFRGVLNKLRMGTLEFGEAKSAEGVIHIPQHRIERVIDTVHMVEKSNSPMNFLVDACAYGLRRYFGGYAYGDDCRMAVLGNRIPQPGVGIQSLLALWPNTPMQTNKV